MTRRPARTPPDPGLGAPIKLSNGDAGGLLDFLGIDKTLPGERITAEEAPPALLQIEPARPGGDEDLMEAWMRFQPGTGLETVMAAEVVGDNVEMWATTGPQYSNNTCVNKVTVTQTIPQAATTQNQASFSAVNISLYHLVSVPDAES